MMTMSVRILVVACALSITLVDSTAHAAKGVKKVNSSNNPRTYSGVVVGVTPNQTGFGTFHVRSMRYHRKTGLNGLAGAGAGGAVNNAGNATGSTASQMHEFTVNGSTQFMSNNGLGANAAMLRPGERVRVRATALQGAANQAAKPAAGSQVVGHHQAVAVQLMSNHMRGRYTRHRTNGYYPHYHHHHVRR